MAKLLMVDDDKWLVEQQARFLADKGYQVRYCYDALSALALIDEDLPDLLILDVLLPSTTIFNLVHELKSYTDTSSVPVILCTNIADRFQGVDLQSYGVKRILDKTTVSPESLLLAVREVLA